MSIFKQKEDENVKDYQKKFNSFLDQMSDDNVINRIFVDLTLLNIELDRNDSFISKIHDYVKKAKAIDKKTYIKLQFEDVLKVSKKYTEQQIYRIKDVLNQILPANEKSNFENFWDAFDKVTGRKK